MKLSIIGSRSFFDYTMLEKILNKEKIDILVSGGAIGADSLGEQYAENNNIPTLIFKPDWKRFGRAAGFIRNKDIIDNSDKVIAFWDGKSKGTLNSINLAKKQNKKVIIYEF